MHRPPQARPRPLRARCFDVDSPTRALLWAIWRQHRTSAWAIAGMTAVSWALHIEEARSRMPGAPPDPSPIVEMLAIVSFLLLVGMFAYVDTDGDKAIGQFPRRLFTLPVSSLRLVAVPSIAGIVAVELFYAAWRAPLSRGEPATVLFSGVLLAAFMILFQTVLWTMAGTGALRIIVAGCAGIVLLAASVLPSLPPVPPPLWRTENGVTVIVAALGACSFLFSWRHIARTRSGGDGEARWLRVDLGAAIASAWPRRSAPFSNAAAAQFWFEWRTGGAVLPALVAGVIVVVIGPLSWGARHDGSETLRLLIGVFATPMALAVAVGIAASKTRFWSEDLSVPPFLAVRPLAAEDIVATKVKIAAASAAAAWAICAAFVVVWLSMWGNLEGLSHAGAFLEAVYGRTGRIGVVALVVIAGMLLTWRFLVCRLSSGLLGNRRLFMISILSIPVVFALAMVFDETDVFDWITDDPARLSWVMRWIGAAVAVKCGFAAYVWRGIDSRYRRSYLLVWLSATAVFVLLAGAAVQLLEHAQAPAGGYALRAMTLSAVLIFPLGRIGLAPACLKRNRHR